VEHLRADTGRGRGLDGEDRDAEANAEDQEGYPTQSNEQRQWPGDDEEDGE
jgi:hypothetical protein